MGRGVVARREFPEWRGKRRRGLRRRESGSRCIVDTVQPETARVQALNRLPVIGTLDRMSQCMHRGRMLGDNQQQREGKSLDQAKNGGGVAGHGSVGLMKHSCSIGPVRDFPQGTPKRCAGMRDFVDATGPSRYDCFN